MPDDLYRPIARALTPSAIGLLARNLGETTGAVRTGLDGAVGSALRAAANKAESEAGAEEVLGVLADSRTGNTGLLTGSPPGFETRLRAAAADDPLVTSTAAVDRLFSGRAPGLVDHLASFAKIQRSSAAALLRLGAALAVAALEDAGAASGGPAGLRRLLRGQRANVQRITPRGFDPDLGGGAARAAERPRWLPWLLTAAALLLLAVVVLRSCERDEPGALVVTVPPEESAPLVPDTGPTEASPP